jgi:hypothetical protein
VQAAFIPALSAKRKPYYPTFGNPVPAEGQVAVLLRAMGGRPNYRGLLLLAFLVTLPTCFVPVASLLK